MLKINEKLDTVLVELADTKKELKITQEMITQLRQNQNSQHFFDTNRPKANSPDEFNKMNSDCADTEFANKLVRLFVRC